MSEPMERVARAIYDVERLNVLAQEDMRFPAWDEIESDRWRILLIDKARAAVAAIVEMMREPSENVVKAGASTRCTLQFGNQAISGEIGEWQATQIFRAMLSAFERAMTETGEGRE